MNEEIWEQYTNDPDFKLYVDRYCKSRGKYIHEALCDIIVRETAKQYKARAAEVVSDSPIPLCDAR